MQARRLAFSGDVLPFMIVTMIWGSTWIVIRDQLGSVPPSWSVCYRFIVAAAGMAVAVRLSGVSFAIPRRALAFAAVLGLMQFCLNFNFVYRAEAHITSGLVALVFALLIVPNSLLARLFFGQRVSSGFVLGSAVAIAGIALLFVHEFRAGAAAPEHVLIGVGFTLCALMSASTANVMQTAPIARSVPMVTMLFWALLIGGALDALWAWATVGPPVVEWRAGYWLGTLYLGLAGSVLTFPLYFRLIHSMGAARAAYSGVLIPVIAMAFSTLLEGYRWTPLTIAGASLAIAGMAIALRMKRLAARTSPTPSGRIVRSRDSSGA